MNRALLTSFVAIGLLAVGPVFGADETYTLRLYQSKKGDKIEREETKTGKTTITVNADGEVKKEETTESDKAVYTEEVLEKKPGDRHASKLTRVYSVSEKTEKGKTTKASYIGETVLIEKKGDKYEFSIKGKKLTEGDAPELFSQFSDRKDNEPKGDDFMPDAPVKVGQSWLVPAAKSEKMFKMLGEEKMKIDLKKSSVGGKLLKAYKRDGAQFAVIEITFTIIVTEVDIGGQFSKVKDGSKMVLKGVLDTCIDGTVQAQDGKMEMTIDVTVSVPNVGVLTISGTTNVADKLRLAKK